MESTSDDDDDVDDKSEAKVVLIGVADVASENYHSVSSPHVVQFDKLKNYENSAWRKQIIYENSNSVMGKKSFVKTEKFFEKFFLIENNFYRLRGVPTSYSHDIVLPHVGN